MNKFVGIFICIMFSFVLVLGNVYAEDAVIQELQSDVSDTKSKAEKNKADIESMKGGLPDLERRVSILEDGGIVGPPGPPGADGLPGEDGAPGADGLNCWDLDGDGSCNSYDDMNNDGVCDALDCQGPPGEDGDKGDPGDGCEDVQAQINVLIELFCNDSNDCTEDSLDMTTGQCDNIWPDCNMVDEDGCCGPDCTEDSDSDCPTVECIDGDDICPVECTPYNDSDCGSGIECIGGDDMCPVGCTPENDTDCAISPADIYLDMIVLLDRSGSMVEDNKWDPALESLISFSYEEAQNNVQLGINFFPPEIGDECLSNSYNPLHVDFELIPSNAHIIEGVLNAMPVPTGSTPTYYALHGSSVVATMRKDLNSEHEVIIVLVTDGAPNTCDSQSQYISSVASLAASSYNYNGVRTYVVTLQGAPVSDFDQVAFAGGTGQAIDISSDTTLLHQTLIDIRDAATAGL